jgi:DNA-binding transcriptional ArsR family regulator
MVVDVAAAEIDLVFHALADATRRDILLRVLETEQSVSALAGAYRMSLPAVQKHVAVLQRAGLVQKRRAGREQRVHAEPERIRTAREVLDAFESLWRHRVAAMDRILAEDRD